MAKQVSVSLDPKHIRIVERHGKKVGIDGFSGALQSIIFLFDQSQRATETPAPAPEPAAEVEPA